MNIPISVIKKIAKIARVNRKTFARVINKKSRLNVLRISGSGRPGEFRSPKKAKKALAVLTAKPNISKRQFSTKIGYSESGLKSYKVQTVPDRNVFQNVKSKNRAKILKRFERKNLLCDG
ncbi:hypothetical protein ACFFRR_005525 [Megaselia abdita]